MVFRISRSGDYQHDLELIFDHLVSAYTNLGDSPLDAFDRAEARLDAIEADADSLALTPHQGTLLSEIVPGLRHVTKNRAIFYFTVDDERQIVSVLALFFGGQDHLRHILKRLGKGD